MLKEYKVWDEPTRIFHWVNFTTVILLIFMGLMMLFKSNWASPVWMRRSC